MNLRACLRSGLFASDVEKECVTCGQKVNDAAFCCHVYGRNKTFLKDYKVTNAQVIYQFIRYINLIQLNF